MFTLRAPASAAAVPVVLLMHDSLWLGLRAATGIDVDVLGHEHAGLLNSWADDVCDNPSGQRAALARAVASLITVAGMLAVTQETHPPPRGFWESTT